MFKNFFLIEFIFIVLLIPSCALLETVFNPTQVESSSSSSKASIPVINYTNLVWSDEFSNGTIDTNSDWTFVLGTGSSWMTGFGNNELENYTDTNYHFEDNGSGKSNLVLDSYYVGPDPNTSGAFTSCRITTAGKREFQYARFSMRIKMDIAGAGGLFAVVFWGSNIIGTNNIESNIITGNGQNWPKCGQFSFGYGNNEDFTNVLGVANYGPDYNHFYSKIGKIAGSTYTNAYHIFDVIKCPGLIVLKMDDKEFLRWETSIGTAYNDNYDQPFNINFLLIAGGTNCTLLRYDINPDTNAFPKHVYIDWVRVYQ
jgi:beta-glucanase (GH16 family)